MWISRGLSLLVAAAALIGCGPERITYEQLLWDADHRLIKRAEWDSHNQLTAHYKDGATKVVTVEKNSAQGAELAKRLGGYGVEYRSDSEIANDEVYEFVVLRISSGWKSDINLNIDSERATPMLMTRIKSRSKANWFTGERPVVQVGGRMVNDNTGKQMSNCQVGTIRWISATVVEVTASLHSGVDSGSLVTYVLRKDRDGWRVISSKTLVS